MLRILFLWPPDIPYDFNLCHHYTEFGEVAHYFLKLHRYNLKIIDAGVMNVCWADIVREFRLEYDCIIIINQFYNLTGVQQALSYSRSISPSSKLLTYGPVSVYCPHFFKNLSFDAIVDPGDYEIGLENFLAFLEGNKKLDELKGVMVRYGDGYTPMIHGDFLSPDKWGFPPLEYLPLDDYFRIYSNFRLHTIGLEGQRELTLTLIRGCSYKCSFCTIPLVSGRQERYRSPTETVDFLQNYSHQFDCVTFYAPTLTKERNYIIELCHVLKHIVPRIRWKCATRVDCVDSEIIELMADAGCYRIGFGVETLEPRGQKYLKKLTPPQRVLEAISLCRSKGIQPVCFIMIGIPGQTKEGILHDIKFLKEAGAFIRATAFTPYNELDSHLISAEKIAIFDKRTFAASISSGFTKQEMLKIMAERD